MKALVMHPLYIPQILEGIVSFDARGYNTRIKGDVYIYDSKAKALVGIITITGTHPITIEEYYIWHHMPLNEDIIDMSHKCYGWDFINPRKINKIKVNKPKDKKIWFDI
ncbi:MAG: hypothetical protein ACI4U5_03350 [Bacilli bacterium]